MPSRGYVLRNRRKFIAGVCGVVLVIVLIIVGIIGERVSRNKEEALAKAYPTSTPLTECDVVSALHAKGLTLDGEGGEYSIIIDGEVTNAKLFIYSPSYNLYGFTLVVDRPYNLDGVLSEFYVSSVEVEKQRLADTLGIIFSYLYGYEAADIPPTVTSIFDAANNDKEFKWEWDDYSCSSKLTEDSLYIVINPE